MAKCRLFAWGANSHAQLGLGFQSEQSTVPHEVDLAAIDLDPEEIVKIVGGAGHTLILDKRGRVYSCGWNSQGQTGHADARTERVIRGLRRVDRLAGERIRDVACGWDSSMALTDNGRLFVWGSNYYGQLGIDEPIDPNERLVEPHELIGLDEGVKGIAIGLRHSALVTEHGKLLVAGSGRKGQLGVLDHEGNPARRLNTFVQRLSDVAAAACGQNHTVVVKKSGEIFAWGDNKHGQLGFDNAKFKTVESPRELKVPEMREIGQLRVGWTHTSFFNPNDGRIFSWGRNTYGQLGYREDEDDATWVPKRVPIAPKIRQLSVGSEHNVALTENGTVLSWGWNEHGNCGNGSTMNLLVPQTVEVSRAAGAILVGSGAGHSFAIFSDDPRRDQ